MEDQETAEDLENIMRNPPKGVQIQKDGSREIITVSVQSKSAIVLMLFALLFSGFTAFAFYKIIEVEPLIGIIFIVPFVFAITFLWIHAFFMMFGKYELVINPKEPDYIFKGMGSLGKKYFIDWPSIKSISEIITERQQYTNPRVTTYGRHSGNKTTIRYLQIEGNKTIKITINDISKEKSAFLVNVLKYYKEKKMRFRQFF